MEANRQAQEARRKINQINESSGGLSMRDLMDGMSADEIRRFSNGLEQFAQETGGQIYNQGYQEPNEASMLMDEFAAEPRPTTGSWKVMKESARLRNGNTVPVWLVADEDSGMEIKRPYRIQEAAQRIAAILNQSGNVNDQRIKRVNEAYEKHIELMKQIRVCKKAINEGQTDKKKRLSALRAKLEEVNYILGI
jgi:paraquat-inducible protein B